MREFGLNIAHPTYTHESFQGVLLEEKDSTPCMDSTGLYTTAAETPSLALSSRARTRVFQSAAFACVRMAMLSAFKKEKQQKS